MMAGEPSHDWLLVVIGVPVILAMSRAIHLGFVRGWGRRRADGTFDLTRHEAPITFWLCMAPSILGTLMTVAGIAIVAVHLMTRNSN